MSSMFLILFYIFAHFFFIELKEYGLKYFVSIILFAAIIQMFMIGFDSVSVILSIWAVNIGIVMLLTNVDAEINNRKKIYSRSIFNMGVSSFVIFTAMSYAFMFVGMYTDFGLSCDTLNKNTSKFIDFVSMPLSISVSKANSLKDSITDFYNKKFVDIIGFDTGSSLICTGSGGTGQMVYERVDVNYFSKFALSGSNLTGDELAGTNLTGESFKKSKPKEVLSGDNLTGLVCDFLSGKDMSTLANLENLKNKDDGDKPGIIGFLTKTKSELFQTLSDKKQLDKGFCDVMMGTIKDKYKNPGFKISVILMIFFVLWPFLRIVFGIVGVIGYVLFMLLRLFKIYQITVQTEEVEEIG